MSLALIDAVSIQHACSAQAASSAEQLKSIQPNPAGTVAIVLCSVAAMGCQAALLLLLLSCVIRVRLCDPIDGSYMGSNSGSALSVWPWRCMCKVESIIAPHSSVVTND